MSPEPISAEVIAEFVELCPELMFADGYDHCIVGFCQRFNDYFVVYDKEMVIETLTKDMSLEDAEEWFSYNIVGAWVGEHTPGFISRTAF